MRRAGICGCPVAVWAGPHVVACLCGDYDLVAVAAEAVAHDAAEILLGRAVDGAVVVGQIEVRDTAVEGREGGAAVDGIVVDAAEVVPQAERYAGQEQTAPAAAGILHRVVA